MRCGVNRALTRHKSHQLRPRGEPKRQLAYSPILQLASGDMQLGPPSRSYILSNLSPIGMETVPSPADAPAHSASTAAAAEIQLEARPAATAVPSHRSNPTDLEIELVHPAASPLELEQYGGGQTSVQVREMEPKDPATKPGSSPIGSIEIELVRSDADKSMTMTLRDGKVPSPRSCPRRLRPLHHQHHQHHHHHHHHHHHTTNTLHRAPPQIELARPGAETMLPQPLPAPRDYSKPMISPEQESADPAAAAALTKGVTHQEWTAATTAVVHIRAWWLL